MGRPRKEEREERIPLGRHRRKLNIDKQDPDYKYRWINDDGSRLIDASNGGYEFVLREATVVGEGGIENEYQGSDSRISKPVGKKEDGLPMVRQARRVDPW